MSFHNIDHEQGPFYFAPWKKSIYEHLVALTSPSDVERLLLDMLRAQSARDSVTALTIYQTILRDHRSSFAALLRQFPDPDL